MRITLGPSVVRGNIDETITGLWTFANVLGLLTDVIGERTGAAGVTVDGLLIKDAGIPEAAVTAHEAALAILESQIADGTILARLAAAEIVTGGWRFNALLDLRARLDFNEMAVTSTAILLSEVTGDSVDRFKLAAQGKMEWGDGALARDTDLFRDAAGVLKTNDSFTVGRALRVNGELRLDSRDMTLSGGATDDDVDIGITIVQRLDPNGTSNISGFAGGTADRVILVCNITGAGVGILSDNVGSVAANRILGPGNANFTLDSRDNVLFWYDGATSRWRTISLNV